MGRNTRHTPNPFSSPRDTYDEPLTRQDLRRALPRPSAETLRATAKQKRREAAALEKHQRPGVVDQHTQFRARQIAQLREEAQKLEAQASVEDNTTPQRANAAAEAPPDRREAPQPKGYHMSSPTVHIERGAYARLQVNDQRIVTTSLVSADLVALCTEGATYWISARDYWRAVGGERVDAEALEAPAGARTR